MFSQTVQIVRRIRNVDWNSYIFDTTPGVGISRLLIFMAGVVGLSALLITGVSYLYDSIGPLAVWVPLGIMVLIWMVWALRTPELPMKKNRR